MAGNTKRYDEWMTERGLGMVEAWCQDGLTDAELAKAMRISVRTLQDWRRKFAEFAGAMTRGRGGAQVQIENALFERARGGIRTVMKPIKLRKREYNDAGRCVREEEVVELAEEQVYIPPDTNAAKFWLTNRAPERWSEKIHVENSGGLTLEDLMRDG